MDVSVDRDQGHPLSSAFWALHYVYVFFLQYHQGDFKAGGDALPAADEMILGPPGDPFGDAEPGGTKRTFE
jgi:hypothetical protein